MQSLSIVLGPFINDAAVPMAHWAIGNKLSCQVDGLLFALGTTATPLYSTSLSIYYYCKLYKKMANDTNSSLGTISEDGVYNDASKECLHVNSSVQPVGNAIKSNSGVIEEGEREYYKKCLELDIDEVDKDP